MIRLPPNDRRPDELPHISQFALRVAAAIEATSLLTLEGATEEQIRATARYHMQQETQVQ